MKLFLLSGFLGSGKTTAIQQACLQLMKQGIHAGVITNDQGAQLVDSAFIKSFQIAHREVVNGCFCCNYSQLEKGIRSLGKESDPGIVFAESVGSCTDVIATVIKPLQQFHAEMEIVLSVFADATVMLKMLEGIPFCFDDDVNYIYEKQLEEADVLVINKADLLDDSQLQHLKKKSGNRFVSKKILYQNSLKEEDILKWLKTLNGFDGGILRKSLEINYDQYGAGEGKLAWLDDEVEIISETAHAHELATRLINRIYEKIKQHQYPVGHLKFFIKAGEWQKKISFTSLLEPGLKQTPSLMRFEKVDMLINARVQTEPEKLEIIFYEAIREVVKDSNDKIISRRLSVFQPGYPKPAHRIEY
ncbi:MAG: hypothetical protein EPN37_01585 [Chitinophagaceae bacterium]|nr:MAG: hypothetical protein EPN37_01585 [Chitinophagaceae bacterium]